jgi:hypothetical protein
MTRPISFEEIFVHFEVERTSFAASAAPPVAAKTKPTNILTRWLHFGFALSIVLCLALSLGMAVNGRGLTGATIAFTLHKFIGLNALLLVSLYLMWSALGHAKSLATLFPWFSARTRKALAEELKHFHILFPHLHAVAAAMQGLGIAVALGATTTGLALVFCAIFREMLGGAESALATMHAVLARGLWCYLAAHGAAAALHALLRHRRMFSIFRLFTPDVDRS